MKQILIGIVATLFSFPAYGLPGDSTHKIQSWIKTHQFLAPYYFSGGGLGYEDVISTFRQLQEGYFVDFSAFISNGKAREESLVLSKREYDPTFYNGSFDKRKWKIIETTNIWFRDNKAAFEIIQAIYGKIIADDFKKAKMVYSGAEYWAKLDALQMEYCRCKIEKSNKYPIIKNGDVNLYMGELWSYEVLVQEDYTHSQIILKSTSQANMELSILLNNLKRYEIYAKEQENKRIRMSPADIKINTK